MHFFVVAPPRTGSTTFMKACEAGGMHVVAEPWRPELRGVESMFLPGPDEPPRTALDWWHAAIHRHRIKRMPWAEVLKLREALTRHRFREPSLEQLETATFPLDQPDGSVTKILMLHQNPLYVWNEFVGPTEDGIGVVLLERHPLETKVSLEERLDWRRASGRPVHASCGTGPQFQRWYERAFRIMAAKIQARPDLRSFYHVQYASNYRADLPSLLDDTDEVFATLAAQGWPLDPVKAAAVIDPAMHTIRIDDLPVRRVA